VQRKIAEAVCDYAATELRTAAADAEHPLRRWVFRGLGGFAERLAAGDEAAQAQIESLRLALIESMEATPVVAEVLARMRAQLDEDLERPESYLSQLVDRKLRDAVLSLLDDAEHREVFDRWVRTTAEELLRRHHHQIGLTVRENLDALDADELVARIEQRVGADLQFIRLNGALVGSLIGVVLAVLHLALD
jgi:uncharacterized membrane-anchored protein YjiN (DUF445 family)